MGPNESWMSDVERELKRAQDQLTGLSVNQLALQSQGNYQLPSRIQQPEQVPQQDELIWIQLTQKVSLFDQNLYSWRRQIKLLGPNGYFWVDTGEGSTIVEYPAVGLNNENLAVNDGKRYPAKWNADTSQWIFFLKAEETPPLPPYIGVHYGIKTWVEWIDRQGLPSNAIALADDLGKPRIIGLQQTMGTNGAASDHGLVHAYTRLNYQDNTTVEISPYFYVPPGASSGRSIPGIGAWNKSPYLHPNAVPSYFLYADADEITGAFNVGTLNYPVGFDSNGSHTINGVHFHYDPDHGANIDLDVAIGNIHFEWNWLPDTSQSVYIRMWPQSEWPTTATGFYSAADMQALYNGLTTWLAVPWIPLLNPLEAKYRSDPNADDYGSAQLAWKWNGSIIAGRFFRMLNPVRIGSIGLNLLTGVAAGEITHYGDYFPGGPTGEGYFRVGNGLIYMNTTGTLSGNCAIEIKWPGNFTPPSSVTNPETP